MDVESFLRQRVVEKNYPIISKAEGEGLLNAFAALSAENAKLRDVLETALSEGMKTQAGRNAVRNALESTAPDPLYASAPEMLELLENISSPRRGTEAENWQIDPRVIQLAARLVDKITFNPADLDEF